MPRAGKARAGKGGRRRDEAGHGAGAGARDDSGARGARRRSGSGGHATAASAAAASAGAAGGAGGGAGTGAGDSGAADADAEAGHGADAQVFMGEWDAEGAYFYQAYNDAIADWALEHQRLGGPRFNATRMTWIKPSFAWMLYRSQYGRKPNQTRVLKVKLPHAAVAELLRECQCKEGGGGSKGRVQWDPARDLMAGEGRVPRKMLRQRAVQIGLKGSLSELYVSRVASIEDVTDLARRVGEAHAHRSAAEVAEAMADLAPLLPRERPYVPHCEREVLERLGMLPGKTADAVARLGFGKAWDGGKD